MVVSWLAEKPSYRPCVKYISMFCATRAGSIATKLGAPSTTVFISSPGCRFPMSSSYNVRIHRSSKHRQLSSFATAVNKLRTCILSSPYCYSCYIVSATYSAVTTPADSVGNSRAALLLLWDPDAPSGVAICRGDYRDGRRGIGLRSRASGWLTEVTALAYAERAVTLYEGGKLGWGSRSCS